MIQSSLAQLLDASGHKAEGAKYHQQAAFVVQNRISQKEAQDWDSKTCGYKNADE